MIDRLKVVVLSVFVVFMALLMAGLGLHSLRQVQAERRSGTAQVSTAHAPNVDRVIYRAAEPRAFASELSLQTAGGVGCFAVAAIVLLLVVGPALSLRAPARKKWDPPRSDF